MTGKVQLEAAAASRCTHGVRRRHSSTSLAAFGLSLHILSACHDVILIESIRSKFFSECHLLSGLSYGSVAYCMDADWHSKGQAREASQLTGSPSETQFPVLSSSTAATSSKIKRVNT